MPMSPRLLRPKATGFTPRSISGLALWLDASSETLYTTDAGPVTAVASPLDIAGCQLWLDASDPASITASSGEVTAWADKSATGSSWTRVGGANGPATGTQTMGGKNVVVFDGTNDGLSAATPLNTSMPLTFFVVQRVVSGSVAGMTYTAGTGDNFNWRQAADTLGTLEVTVGGSRMQLGGALLSQNTLYSLTVPASSNASIYRDGTVVSISTNAALKPTLTGTHYLGRRSDGFYGNVHIAEIIAYSAELTTAQRASVESYLAAKWGISGVHRSAAQEIAAVASPLELGGCLCWYDAADASSITKDGSNLVSQWNDKSGNNRHATTSGSLRPTSGGSQNGRTVMQFTGTQAMTITGNFLQSDNVTMFAVAMKNTDHYGGIISSAPSNPEDSPVLTFYLTTIAWLNRRVLVQQATGNGVYRIVSGQSVGTAQRGFFDGVRGTDTTASVATNTAGTITKIGALRTSSTADLNGNIAEIVCYSGVLSDVDRARVEKYLQQKWATPTVPDPTPPVGYWADKSGNGRHAVQSLAGSRPLVGTQNSRTALTFDGTDDNLRHTPSTALGAAEVTHIAVLRNNLTTQPNLLYAPGIMTSGNQGRPLDRWQGTPLTGAVFVGATPQIDVTSPFRSLDSRFVLILDGKKDGVSAGTHQLREFINGASIYSATSTGTWVTTSQRINIGTRDDGGTRYKGDICELLMYDRLLTTTERQRVERYLAARWGITLAPTVANADAQDWINRVYANGGTVSSATAASVNQLCDSLDASGVRPLMYRMGIFAGSNLNAALVPLYRGPSLGGTQYGGATDTNNAFVGVGTDYAETGATGGLKGNGSTKYLDTGLAGTTFSAGDRHCSAYWNANATLTGNRTFIGNTDTTSNTAWMDIHSRHTNPGSEAQLTNAASLVHTGANRHQLVQYNGATSAVSYSDGGDKKTLASFPLGAPTAAASNWFVFGVNPSLFGGVRTDARICTYSIGLSMSDANALAFYNAVHAFQTALGRQA